MKNPEQRKEPFLNCKPILRVKDVTASLDYYCSKLGFAKVFAWKDEVGFCDNGKLDFAEVRRGGASIMLSREQSTDKGIWIYVDIADSTVLDQLYAELKERGANIIESPNEKEWNMREITVKDLDDNYLRIGAPSAYHE
jgi:uncharacterized glyoxalase superfamily protein PhnB